MNREENNFGIPARVEVPEDAKVIALSFDDGPNMVTTVEVLDKLEKYGVIASFFLIGEQITEETKEVMQRMVDMGCEIQNHSMTHQDMTKMSKEAIHKEIEETSDRIESVTGVRPTFFRPPYLIVNDDLYDCIDMTFIAGIHGEDWNPDVKADERAGRILKQATDGNIILLHDLMGNVETVKALDTIIPALIEEGFVFVPVSQLFEERNVDTKESSKFHRLYSNCLQTTEK